MPVPMRGTRPQIMLSYIRDLRDDGISRSTAIGMAMRCGLKKKKRWKK